MQTIHKVATVSAVLLLCIAFVGPAFGQPGRSGGPGMGGSHHRPGGGLGLVNPSGYSGTGYGYGYGGGGFGGGGWGAWFPGYPNDPYGYQSGRIPTPPYFAIHPPVYYGKRVGMPYGNSAVTRPPRAVVDVHPMVQPVAQARQSQMILNPYASEVSEAAEDSSSEEPPAVAQDRAVTSDQPTTDN